MTPEEQAFLARLNAWRALSRIEQEAYFESQEGAGTHASLAGPGFDRDRHLDLKLMVLGCDYRGGPAVACGCTKTRVCLMGKGRPIPGTDATDVTDEDCRGCVRGDS